MPWEILRARSDRRARRRTDLAALEQLEGRIVLSYSSLGFSVADLTISGEAGPVAAWGGNVQLTTILQNTGASTIVEPLALVPASQVTIGPDGLPVPPYAIPSTADATVQQIGVYLARGPHSLKNAIKLGTIAGAAITQNDIQRFSSTVTLPSRPKGFPGAGGTVYLRLIANETRSVIESNVGNNVSNPIPIRIFRQALPSLKATALDVPPSMQPSDTIAPTIQITNLGTANTALQGPVEVALVASTTPDFNLGSSIVALYTVNNGIPGLSATPIPVRPHRSYHRRVIDNVQPAANTVTINGPAVTLPPLPQSYFLGVVIDPNNKLKQLYDPSQSNRFQLIRQVGPSTGDLPPAGSLTAPLNSPFPIPANGTPIGVPSSTV